MKSKNALVAAMGVLALAGSGLAAAAADLKASYFHGTWIINDTDCSDVTAEFATLYDSGAVRTERSKRVESAGIWELKDDMLQAHIVASPSYFSEHFPEARDTLDAFAGQYYAFFIRVVPFNVQPDSFEAVGVLEQEITQATFQRCPG